MPWGEVGVHKSEIGNRFGARRRWNVFCTLPCTEGMPLSGRDKRRSLKEYTRSDSIIFRSGKREGEKRSRAAPKEHSRRDSSVTEKRLLPVSGKQMVKVFRKIGFQVERQRGSHIVMSKGEAILVIPNHDTYGSERNRA